jgi:hypothetical protein
MSDGHRPNIYALLVGIDGYRQPVPALGGCRKDVARIRQYLQTHFAGPEAETQPLGGPADGLTVTRSGLLRLCTLEDEQATYHNIIRGFREHLTQATHRDVVWFHFSGHGTESFTAPEFKVGIEPNGKDQNLICYHAGEEPSLLADKELAVLLHEVATANGSGQPPHLLVSLDCCHAGSGTRDALEPPGLKSRFFHLPRARNWETAAAKGQVRNLDGYLAGYFRKNGAALPLTRHMLLAACSSVQTAGDLPGGGIFTTGLIEALETAGGDLNYADLFLRARATVQRLRTEQWPQFETIGSFDPYTRFLDGRPLGMPDRFEVMSEGDTWLVKCGAIHGLPSQLTQPVELDIYHAPPDSQPLGRARLLSVGAQKSQLQLTDDMQLQKGVPYQAVLLHLPAPPAVVHLSGEAQALQLLIEQWDDRQHIRYVTGEASNHPHPPDIRVEATDGQYRLIDLARGRLVLQYPQTEAKVRLILASLAKMARWRRVLALDNPRSGIAGQVSLQIKVQLRKGTEWLQDPQQTLTASPDTFLTHQDMLYGAFYPQVTIHDTHRQLFCYLLLLRSDYSIAMRESPVVFRPHEFPGKKEVSLPLYKEGMGWGLGPDDTAATAWFKLLVTTEELDYHQLLQSSINGDRLAEWAYQPLIEEADWWSQTMQIHLTKQA